jgi:UDP-N-acetylglucosamine diphosphorylase / glucose-1-phosphate thymidylyltransferase / UDP-N-acetylgalactosamine diphosphorylase / glucosamine-1-phosphate N-acetyltransferase / galactosamine-1-phosphate N-acetyltransferase
MIFLNDKILRANLFPFTQTRHTAQIRIGILTIQQKWEYLLGQKVYLQPTNNTLEIPANIVPKKNNFKDIIALAEKNELNNLPSTIQQINYPWHIFQHTAQAIQDDFDILNKENNAVEKFVSTNSIINPQQVFIAPNAQVSHAILNATNGPIYIDENAAIQEGAIIRGPFYAGKNAVIKMGAKIFEGTSIGNYSTAGGEIKNSVMLDYSNKAHDGYLGSSVIGSWCNLGAGTSNSNIKNTAGEVHIQISQNDNVNAGQKAGLFLGDYSRCAINTSFNTGTVVGVCCNIFGNEMPPKFMPNFTWGDELYQFDKAIQHINNWMQLKNENLTTEQINTLNELYSQKISKQ